MRILRVSIRGQSWLGTRGSEIQILSPRQEEESEEFHSRMPGCALSRLQPDLALVEYCHCRGESDLRQPSAGQTKMLSMKPKGVWLPRGGSVINCRAWSAGGQRQSKTGPFGGFSFGQVACGKSDMVLT